MNFDNPMYRPKAKEDDFSLEKPDAREQISVVGLFTLPP